MQRERVVIKTKSATSVGSCTVREEFVSPYYEKGTDEYGIQHMLETTIEGERIRDYDFIWLPGELSDNWIKVDEIVSISFDEEL